ELGGLDLVVMGVGVNGHIGYNEPGSFFDSRTRVVRLTPGSVARIFTPLPVDGVRRGLTMGIATILEAREILLLASGPGKRESIKALLEGPETTDMPVTVLRRHPKLTVILDRDADPRPHEKTPA
ncbi:MAG: 6-phosphogluconolactonase, partial [Deltaproteobacteria bacterium]|nr:6-phosphogluconolactonase [Deltaproteobacteria bacterium]